MAPLIIIGTGIAGYSLAREFRKLDDTMPLVMITTDDGQNYPKPMLSNALSKAKNAAQIALSDVTTMAKNLNAEILTYTNVKYVDPGAKLLKTSKGEYQYSQLVFAVGAAPRKIAFEGDVAEAALSINSLDDYAEFRRRLEQAEQIAIIGAGLIGCEFANDLISIGKQVSVVGLGEQPLEYLLPNQIGNALKNELGSLGVEWHMQSSVFEINKIKDHYQLTLISGEQFEADLVVSAVGLQPNVALAKTAGLAVNIGIKTDEFLKTSADSIFALGDCAEVAGHNLLYIAPILLASRALAKTLTGDLTKVTYPPMPVVIKTPCLPLVVCPPPNNQEGKWRVESDSALGIKATFVSNGEQVGFALSGAEIANKQTLAKKLPNLLN